jgi:alpha-ribazole phosphatase
MTFYLVRHGAPDTPDNLCLGQHDVALSDAGRQAMTTLGETWQGPPPHRLISSDLRRAEDAALALGADWDLEVTADPRLREMSFGTWEGRSWADIEEGDPERLQAWMNDWVETPAPEGEAFVDLADRVQHWLSEVQQAAADDEHIVTVAHAGTIRAVLCQVLGLPLERAFRLHVDHAHVSTVASGQMGLEVLCANARQFADYETY